MNSTLSNFKSPARWPIHPSNRILYDFWTLHPSSPSSTLVPNLWHWDPNTWLQRMGRFWSSTNILMVTWWMKNSISLLTSILGKVKKIYICHLDAAYEWNMIHNLTTVVPPLTWISITWISTTWCFFLLSKITLFSR